MNAIELRQLTAGYGRGDVLHQVTTDIPTGQFTAIVGPNGSGKTTLFRCITGTIKVDRGHVFVMDRDVRDYSARQLAKALAVVPQRSYTEYAFTVWDIVRMGRYAYTSDIGREKSQDREVVQWAMECTETWELRERNAAELSGGEWQRVIIARAFAQQPHILLMDEPVNSLDINHQVGILNMVKRLTKQQGMTVVCVLHDLNLAMHYAEHVILMQEGKPLHQGKPRDVLTPEHILDVYQLPVVQVGDGFLLPVFKPE